MGATKTEEKTLLPAGLGARILREGYADAEAWHGNNLRAALADVSPELAFWRPAPGRHTSRILRSITPRGPGRSARDCRVRRWSRSP